MKLARPVLRSLSYGVSRQFCCPPVAGHFSIAANLGNGTGDKPHSDAFESADDFERPIFGDSTRSNSRTGSFFWKFDGLLQGQTGSRPGNEGDSGMWNGLDDIHDTLDDGMNTSNMILRNVMRKITHSSRYESQPGTTYDVKLSDPMSSDLDLRRPGVWTPTERSEFEVTIEEVLRKADFRTGISAKARKKMAREIKTARAFGLVPFTTMGTKYFVCGKSMQNLDKDYEYEVFDNPADDVFDAQSARRGMF